MQQRRVTTSAGLFIAIASGSLLFATRAGEYAVHPAFLLKLIFILLGSASAVFAHARYGRTLEAVPRLTAIRIGDVSVKVRFLTRFDTSLKFKS